MLFQIIYIFFFLTITAAHDDHGISDNDHYNGGKTHNPDFDHDAFLGKGHGHDFDNLDPEEAKERLGRMAKKIDTNNDDSIEFEELRVWVEKQRTAYMWDTLDIIIRNNDEDKDGHISWLEYKHAHFGKFKSDDHIDRKLKAKIDEAQRKFLAADSDKDEVLSKYEYGYFRHPEESSSKEMQDIAIDEVISEMDKDGDKLIDLDEFLGQYLDDNGNPPDWVMEDRKHYQDTLDTDKSGVLEREEMSKWVLPNHNDAYDEARHLIDSADEDRDERLSIQEIIEHYDLFVGSTATDHGKALHHEL